MKKLLAMLLVVFTLLNLVTVATIADEDPTSPVYPPNILGESTFGTTTILSFDEENIMNSVKPPKTQPNRCTFALVDGAPGNKKALEIICQENPGETDWIKLPGGEQDFTIYDGVLFYINTKNVIKSTKASTKVIKNKTTGETLYEEIDTTGVSIRFNSVYTNTLWTRNDRNEEETDPEAYDWVPKSYFYDEKSSTWIEYDRFENHSNGGEERCQVPIGWEGWAYIPFEEYFTRMDGKHWTNVNTSGAFTAIDKVSILTGWFNKSMAVGQSIIVDEITLVKKGSTQKQLDDLIDQMSQEGGDGDVEEEDVITTAAPTTAAPTTAAVTTAAPTTGTNVATDAQSESRRGGCGSSVTLVGGLTLFAMIPAAAFSFRRKKD